jgi:hypothetical protein
MNNGVMHRTFKDCEKDEKVFADASGLSHNHHTGSPTSQSSDGNFLAGLG